MPINTHMGLILILAESNLQHSSFSSKSMTSWNVMQNCTAENCKYIEELTYMHLYTLAIVFFFIFIFFFIISTTLSAKEKAFIQNLPRSNLNVGRDLLSSKMKKIVGNERAYAKSVTFPPPGLGDSGYDILIDEVTHERKPYYFQSVVKQSYLTIDTQISKYFPEYKLKSNQTIADYIDTLRRNIPGISQQACENYIQTYELAQFSQKQWTKEDFFEWCGFLDELIQSIEQAYVGDHLTKDKRQISLVPEIEEDSSEEIEDDSVAIHPNEIRSHLEMSGPSLSHQKED